MASAGAKALYSFTASTAPAGWPSWLTITLPSAPMVAMDFDHFRLGQMGDVTAVDDFGGYAFLGGDRPSPLRRLPSGSWR